MKHSVKPGLLKLFALSAGLLGLMLRLVLYFTAVDQKGMLIAGHWAGVSQWVLTALVVVLIFVLTAGMDGPTGHKAVRPAPIPAALGCFALAAAIGCDALAALADFPHATTMGALILAWAGWALKFLSAAALVCTGICRVTGRKSWLLSHALLSAFFAVRMVSQYQQWSADPQMLDYVFHLCAFVALMLTAYHQAAFDADMGRHRPLWLLSLVAVYLCALSLVPGTDPWLMLASGFWALTNLTRVRQHPGVPGDAPSREEV